MSGFKINQTRFAIALVLGVVIIEGAECPEIYRYQSGDF